MSIASQLNRPMTLGGVVATFALVGGLYILVPEAVNVVLGKPVELNTLGLASFGISIFAIACNQRGIFKDTQAKPAQ